MKRRFFLSLISLFAAPKVWGRVRNAPDGPSEEGGSKTQPPLSHAGYSRKITQQYEKGQMGAEHYHWYVDQNVETTKTPLSRAEWVQHAKMIDGLLTREQKSSVLAGFSAL